MRSGDVLHGRYRLDEPIGHGGMGEVWSAVDERLDARVAIKFLGRTAMDQLARFEREAKLLAQLDRPTIVRVTDFVVENEPPFLVMSLVDGHSLETEIGIVHPPGRVREVLGAILDALAWAHHVGVVHRDVKPSNVLIGHRGEVALTDFGIARADGTPGMTIEGTLVGTPEFWAPEQARGEAATAASDVFAAGLIAYELLTGRRPFPAPEGGDRVAAARERAVIAVPAIAQVAPHVAAADPALVAVVAEMTALDPTQRPHATNVLERLRDSATMSDTSPSTLPPVSAEPKPRRRRRRAVIVALVILLLGAAGAAAAFLFVRDDRSDLAGAGTTTAAAETLPATSTAVSVATAAAPATTAATTVAPTTVASTSLETTTTTLATTATAATAAVAVVAAEPIKLATVSKSGASPERAPTIAEAGSPGSYHPVNDTCRDSQQYHLYRLDHLAPQDRVRLDVDWRSLKSRYSDLLNGTPGEFFLQTLPPSVSVNSWRDEVRTGPDRIGNAGGHGSYFFTAAEAGNTFLVLDCRSVQGDPATGPFRISAVFVTKQLNLAIVDDVSQLPSAGSIDVSVTTLDDEPVTDSSLTVRVGGGASGNDPGIGSCTPTDGVCTVSWSALPQGLVNTTSDLVAYTDGTSGWSFALSPSVQATNGPQ